MIDTKVDIIREAIAEGTGASIGVEIDVQGLRTALHLWFSDLRQNSGPYVELKPSGLKRHLINLQFGNFAAPIIHQISKADEEAVHLARALFRTVNKTALVQFSDGYTIDDWKVEDGEFNVSIERKHIADNLSDDALVQTCKDIVVPVMAAMAELIGYDEILPEMENDEPAWEGAVRPSTINRRERNPRNRLLCLRIHGYCCQICGVDPREKYGLAGSIIEVHHLEPISLVQSPRRYDPESDLIPLCPSCHKAIHSRRPVPWTPSEVKGLMANV